LLSLLLPGLYHNSAGHTVYVGVEHELPDPAGNEFYEPATQRYGDLPAGQHLRRVRGIREERRVVRTPEGPLGVSLYYADNKKRTTVILIHGNDPETREMGFLIPYFVLNGVNVVSYDQRGTGKSTGDWWMSGPQNRAVDVETLYDVYSRDPHVDKAQFGVFGFSNGGWTAPIVATHRPIAFMLLKSPPAESIVDNIYYTVKEQMLRYHHSNAEIQKALDTCRALFGALSGTVPWDVAKTMYASAQKQSWFKDSRIPGGLQLPMQGAVAEGYRRAFFYDPTDTLQKVRTPAIALFGAKDRNVDVAHAAPAFARIPNVTVHVYPNAIHTLVLTRDGFTPARPERLVPGYPAVMMEWLADKIRHRGGP
jgi:pimeloyl-ACP methyl ester carboxylesterase